MAKSPSKLELIFVAFWKAAHGAKYGLPVQEFCFAPPRKFRFDCAWPDKKVACEIEGGIWVSGRHNRGRGFISDCDKYNIAVLNGWRVLRFTEKHLADRPLECVDMVRDLLGA